jgi:hypothetical protein
VREGGRNDRLPLCELPGRRPIARAFYGAGCEIPRDAARSGRSAVIAD